MSRRYIVSVYCSEEDNGRVRIADECLLLWMISIIEQELHAASKLIGAGEGTYREAPDKNWAQAALYGLRRLRESMDNKQ